MLQSHELDVHRSEAVIPKVPRDGPISHDAQLDELKPWRLLDFREEPDERAPSERMFAAMRGCGRNKATLLREIFSWLKHQVRQQEGISLMRSIGVQGA
jgi:hypothetical protein